MAALSAEVCTMCGEVLVATAVQAEPMGVSDTSMSAASRRL